MDPQSQDPNAQTPPNPLQGNVPVPEQQPAAFGAPEPVAPQAPAQPSFDTSASAPSVESPVASTTPLAGTPDAPTPAPSPFGQAAPDAQAATTDPSAPVFAAAPPPTPPSSSKAKKIALIAGIAGGVVLLIVAAVIAYVLLMTVSKQDYQAAAQQYNATSAASTSLTTKASLLSLGLSSSSEEEFTADAKELEEAIATLEEENAALGELKAVRVGEGKEVYATFNTKLTEYVAYAKDLVASVKTLRPALVKCNEVGDATATAARVSALNACAAALNGVGEMPNAEFKTYVDTIKTEYTTYAATYESISKLTSPFGSQSAQYKTLRDTMYDTQDNILAASKSFSEAIEKRDDEVSVKESATALGEFLTEQQQ